MGLFIGIPASVVELHQQGLLERAFHDSLFPNLAFRAEALWEEWPANTGEEIFMTRRGLLPEVTTPTQPGHDPEPQAVPFEQWSATLGQYTGAIDTHMPSSVTAQASQLISNLHTLGLQAGRSINQIARNALFQAYLSGQTVANTAVGSADTQLQVASINGFTDVVIPGTNVRPKPVSPSYPLQISIGTGGAAVTANVIGFIQADPSDPLGPGILQLAAAVGANFAIRSPIKSAYAPRIIRASGGDSVDTIGPADTLVLQQAINAVGFLRDANVQPHEDGFYHAHIGGSPNAQLFADPVFQRLNQSLPEHVIYKEGFIGTMSGVMFYMNTEAPRRTNTGKLTATSAATGSTRTGVYASGVGAEVVNGNGVEIGRVIITGRGALYEKGLDESQYTTEAGMTGKTGEFDVINNGIAIPTERIRLVLRSPLDRLGQVVSAAWSISTSFPTPSDLTAPSGPERFKRAIVLEFAQ